MGSMFSEHKIVSVQLLGLNLVGRLCEGLLNARERCIEISHDFVAAQPHDCEPLRCKPCIAPNVFLLLFRVEMMRPICLDNHSRLEACEVRDIGTNGDLPAELPAFEPPVAKFSPQAMFERAQVAPLCACEFAARYFKFSHRCLKKWKQ